MYKFYVTRGYPLDRLLESTYAERVLLREAYREYSEMWEKAGAAAEAGNSAG